MPQQESKLDQLLRQRAEIDELLRRHQTAFSVLFTDVVGSTEYFEKYGDIAGVTMLSRHEDLARKAIEERGGRVIKNIGDSVMAEFPDAVAAARTAVEIQHALLRLNQKLPERERIQLRIGLNHGTGFRHEGDVYGDVVNVASRITKRTGPAQILVSASVKEAVEGLPDLRCNWLGKVAMKGKEEEGDVYEIVWTDTNVYTELREHVTLALKRGDLMAPGLDVNQLLQAPPPTPPPAPVSAPAGKPRRDSVSFATPPPEALESRYEILGELGSGGMGVVYKARDRETNDLVALKVLRPEVAANEKGMARFKNELRVARRITHKNVCRIYDFGRTETTAYISMEYVEGESLRRLLHRLGSLGLRQGIHVALQICAGLREAHAQGVVHRDLKPENIMLDAAGSVKIMDFGIAHAPLGSGLTQTNAVVGTPTYMAPEQAEGKPVDHRTDLYALGLILYEIFTGSPTFSAETPVAVAIKHILDTPLPPRALDASIPGNLNDAILKCLEKDPAKRYQSVDGLAGALGLELPRETGPEARAHTGEVAPSPAPTPMPSDAYYSPTPYGAAPASPLPALPSVSAPAESPAHAPPAAAQQTLIATAPLPTPAAPRPAPRSHINQRMIIGAVLATGLFAVFGLVRLLREPRIPPAPAQHTIQQQVTPSTAAPSPASQPLEPSAGAQPSSGASQPSTASRAPSAPLPPQPADSAVATKTAQTSAALTPAPASATPASAPPAPVLAPVSVRFSFARTLAGHTAAVSSVAFSPDGRWVATGSRDKTVRVWEVGTGKTIHTLKGHKDAVSSVAFSPDGRLIASGSLDRTVIIWEGSSGQAVASLPRESGFVLCVTFSPEARLLAASTSDGRIKIWGAGSGEGLQAFEGHTGPVYSIVFSPDGRWLASAGRDQTVRLWNVAAGQEARVLRGHSDAVNTAVFSPDGRWLASASDDKTVRLWEVSSGRELRAFAGQTGSADGLAFGSDDRWLAAGSEDKTVRVWDTATGSELAALTGHLYAITDLAVSRNGRWLASAAGDNTVRLWRRE